MLSVRFLENRIFFPKLCLISSQHFRRFVLRSSVDEADDVCVCADEGQFLEGEERIAFLMSKIQDLRRVYMDLKAEVACIDRRRRRHRIKEREGK